MGEDGKEGGKHGKASNREGPPMIRGERRRWSPGGGMSQQEVGNITREVTRGVEGMQTWISNKGQTVIGVEPQETIRAKGANTRTSRAIDKSNLRVTNSGGACSSNKTDLDMERTGGIYVKIWVDWERINSEQGVEGSMENWREKWRWAWPSTLPGFNGQMEIAWG